MSVELVVVLVRLRCWLCVRFEYGCDVWVVCAVFVLWLCYGCGRGCVVAVVVLCSVVAVVVLWLCCGCGCGYLRQYPGVGHQQTPEESTHPIIIRKNNTMFVYINSQL